MTYGEKIARLRKSKGMTQEELGKVLNVTYQAVSKWERGESLPDFPTMSQISKFFEVPLDYFEEGNDALGEATPASAAAAAAVTANNIAGICTVCGKMLKNDEIYATAPKIICKNCAERQKKEAEILRKEEERAARARKTIELQQQLGSGCNIKLIISIVLAVVCFIALSVLCFKFGKDEQGGKDAVIGGAFLLALMPQIVLACAIAFGDLISELRDSDDTDGYTLKISLIVSGIFAAANLIISIILFIAFREPMLFATMAIGIVISFTFSGQILWGSVLKEIFTCGGFTFKLPGFIFSLTPESIIWMIVTKVFLGILSVLLFIATTILLGLVAIFGSVFTFIPCLISKIHKDNSARAVAKI